MVREIVDRKKNNSGNITSTSMRSSCYSSYEPDCSASSHGDSKQDTAAAHIPDVTNDSRFISPSIGSQQTTTRDQYCNAGKNNASMRLNQIAMEISRAQTVIKQEVKWEPPDSENNARSNDWTNTGEEKVSLSRWDDNEVTLNSNVSNSYTNNGKDIDKHDCNQLRNFDQMNISPSPPLSQFSIMWQLQNSNSGGNHTPTSSSSDPTTSAFNSVPDPSMNSSLRGTRIGQDSLPSIPDAYEIQRHLQNTISLTSFQPLSDSTDCDRVSRLYPSGHMDVRLQTFHNLVSATASPSVNVQVPSCGLAKSTPPLQRSPLVNKSKNEDQYQTSERKFQEKHVREKTRYRPYGGMDRTGARLAKQVREALAYTSYLQYVLNTLLKQWEEYITLPDDRLHDIESQNGRESNYNEDAQAMLDDEHSHIWQLVRDMQPRDFSLDPEKLFSSLASQLPGSNRTSQQSPGQTTSDTTK